MLCNAVDPLSGNDVARHIVEMHWLKAFMVTPPSTSPPVFFCHIFIALLTCDNNI